MTPSEIDQKIIKLLRLSMQRDNVNEARAANAMAHKLAKRFNRDIEQLTVVAEGCTAATAPSPAPSEPDIDDGEYDEAVRDFATILGGVFDIVFPSRRPSQAVRVAATLHDHRAELKNIRNRLRQQLRNRKKKG